VACSTSSRTRSPAYERIERLFVAAGRIQEAPPPSHRAGAGFVFG
jgi:hypothetical protein